MIIDAITVSAVTTAYIKLQTENGTSQTETPMDNGRVPNKPAVKTNTNAVVNFKPN